MHEFYHGSLNKTWSNKLTWASRTTIFGGIVEPNTTNNSLEIGHGIAFSIAHFSPHFFFWWGLKCARGRDTRPHSIPILFSSLLWNTSLVVPTSSQLSHLFCYFLVLLADNSLFCNLIWKLKMRAVQSAGLSLQPISSPILQFVDIASVLNACLPSNHVLYAGKDFHQVDRQSRITLSCLLLRKSRIYQQSRWRYKKLKQIT